MVVALFLKANRIDGLEAQVDAWPWEVILGRGTQTAASVLATLWVLTGVLAIGLAFLPSPARRAAVLLPLGTVLFVQCATGAAGLTMEVPNLNQMLPLMLLGGGLLLAAGRETNGRGRALMALGAVVYLCVSTSLFDTEGSSYLGATLRDFRDLVRDVPFPDVEQYYHWKVTIPRSLLLLTSALALLSVPWRAHRWAYIGLLAALAVGLLISLVGFVAATAARQGTVGAPSVVRGLAAVLVNHGLLTWLLAVFVIQDAGHPEEAAA
jgi:hypothetical protein